MKNPFLTLLATASLFLYAGCKNPVDKAIETPTYSSERYGGDWKGFEEYEEDVAAGVAAVDKVPNEPDLIRITREAHNGKVRAAALKKVSDQVALTHSVFNDAAELPRKAAAARIADARTLARVCFHDPESSVREAAVERLRNPGIFPALNSGNNDQETRLISIVIQGFNGVPVEHRSRLISGLLPAITFLRQPDMSDNVGDILSVEASWSPTSAGYALPHSSNLISLRGEILSVSIALKRFPQGLATSWVTSFPNNILGGDTVLHPASMDLSALLGGLLARLSDEKLADIAIRETDRNICWYCLRKIEDKKLIARIALEAKDWAIRRDAAEGILDQSLLQRIVTESKDSLVISLASRRLQQPSDARPGQQ